MLCEVYIKCFVSDQNNSPSRVFSGLGNHTLLTVTTAQSARPENNHEKLIRFPYETIACFSVTQVTCYIHNSHLQAYFIWITVSQIFFSSLQQIVQNTCRL